uniref:Uncharacterized protein n=1 Tax=Wuchereria bancrofti TaxID=6293 RepID=A0A1I8EFM8_WUCBA
MNLIRLHGIINEKSYYERAEKIFESTAERLVKYPFILTKMVNALQKHVRPVKQVPMQVQILFSNYTFHSWLQSVDDHLKLLATSTDTPTAYICENFECSLPFTSFNFQHSADGAVQLERSMVQLYCSSSNIGRKLAA